MHLLVKTLLDALCGPAPPTVPTDLDDLTGLPLVERTIPPAALPPLPSLDRLAGVGAFGMPALSLDPAEIHARYEARRRGAG